MSSGKQLSFAFGEVSPSLRFKVDTNFYSQALFKLKNGYVKRSGGVSNRPGTNLYQIMTFQNDLTSKTKKQGLRIFSFTGVDNRKYIVELRRNRELIDPDSFPTATYRAPLTIYDRLGNTTYFDYFDTFIGSSLTNLNLDTAVFVQMKDFFVIHVKTMTGVDLSYQVFLYYDEGTSSYKFSSLGSAFQALSPIYPSIPSATSNLSITGQNPLDIPVCYMITQEQSDGYEFKWQEFCFNLGHPHSFASSKFTVDVPKGKGIRQYNVYRSSGGFIPGATAGSQATVVPGHYYLVGRIPPQGNDFEFRDFISTPDLTVQPPTDLYLYPPGETFLRRSFFYKERVIIAYKRRDPVTGESEFTIDKKYEEGQLGVSKLGSTKMFGRPLTPNEIDAFSFVIPSEAAGQITNGLVMSRLILFTKDHAIAIRGGEAGILSYLAVNPDVIYNEGSCEDVVPVAQGNVGFYVSYDKTKLLMIRYAADDSVSVSDVSALSDHLFDARDIKRMEIVRGPETMLYILKKDGTMIQMSYSESTNIVAFNTYETDGYIEDICLHESNKFNTRDLSWGDDLEDVETLYLTVIRNGVRYLEYATIRYDNPKLDYQKMVFSDCSTISGERLDFKNREDLPSNPMINITGPSFLAAESLTLTDVSALGILGTLFPTNSRIKFFYDFENEDGETVQKSIILIVTAAVAASNTITAMCEEDIPEILQDVDGNPDLSAEEKAYIMTGFTSTTKIVPFLTYLAGREVSVFADGEVLSSPGSQTYETLTVGLDGNLDLGDYYGYVVVGIPYDTIVETLDIEVADQRTLTDTGKMINALGIALHNTKGGYVGQSGIEKDLSIAEEMSNEWVGDFDQVTGFRSGYYKFTYPSNWENTGRVSIKQIDPLPLSVLAVYPKGVTGDA